METIERVAQIMVTLEEFSDLLEIETAAVKEANTLAIQKLRERKEFLTLHYQRQLRMLSDRRADLAELDDSVKHRLRVAWNSFGRIVTENAQALEVAQYATRQVVDMIVSAVRDAQGAQREQAYRGSGESGKPPVSACVSVAVNHVL